MENTLPPVLLAHEEASEWNRDLMLQFQVALEQNPTADLLSMFPSIYHREHRSAQRRQTSWAASINLNTIESLCDAFDRDPEVNLVSKISDDYESRIRRATGQKREPLHKKKPEIPEPTQFRTRLDDVDEATVVFPLSDQVVALLSEYSECVDSSSKGIETSLVRSLKDLLWDSSVLSEEEQRGVVVKCNEQIVAKVVEDNDDHTEYTSMEYLEKEAPSIPAPRPHGLIKMGEYRVIFMSYIGDVTLAKVWPELSHEAKSSIQRQLDNIFQQLRTLRQPDGEAMGGVCGEGTKIYYGFLQTARQKQVTGARQFVDFIFSIPHRHGGGTTYFKFLSAFLDNTTMSGSVFTHGDVRRENIMVRQDPHEAGAYVISGIIDWEGSGFYPDFFESTNLTRHLGFETEDDWYLYIPQSILSAELTVQWLIERIWQIYHQSA